MRKLILKVIDSSGYVLVRRRDILDGTFPADITDDDRQILIQVSSYTMISVERHIALMHAARDPARSGIRGWFVECGVWKSGSSKLDFIHLVDNKRKAGYA